MSKIIFVIVFAILIHMYFTFDISDEPLTHNRFGDISKARGIWRNIYGDEYDVLKNKHLGTTEEIAWNIMCQHINQINYYRSLHGVPDLKMHIELNEVAQILANHIVKTKYYEHGPTQFMYGENICLQQLSFDAGKRSADLYYDEFFKLDKYGNPYNFNGTEFEKSQAGNSCIRGHAISIVWKNAREIGVGVAYGNSFYDNEENFEKSYIITAVINPATNVIGEFVDNVVPRETPFYRLILL
ncbi:Golgi-associated plant pathogenesis-related protein 1-like [Daktulosphaira vitifoliae]|uniref:Golgi-associated plant pathogenesis-related protein 1-like n=1 Tax=Daktulosphaira vitifoliae TaxID=58002 RepID=UPI0021AA1682|nr:Golgi-associated plant pathogenesis-related protein 1-like [Daktulosphaira vitifoliae]